MQQIFEPSFAGVYLDQLRQEYQIRSSIATSDDLTVPGDTTAKLDHAKPLSSTVGSAPSLTSTQTGSGSDAATSAPSSPSSGSTPNPQETTQ